MEGFTAEVKEVIDSCVELARSLANGSEIKTEVQVSAIGSDFKRLFCGTCDVLIIFKNESVLIDWKFGRNEVEEAVENIQLAAYALAVMQQYGVAHVECHVFQPRINHHSKHTYHSPENLQSTIQDIITRAKDPNAALLTGDHCKYCKGQQICPEYRKLATAPLAKIEPNMPPVSKWGDEELSEFRYRCGLLKKLEAVVEAEMKERCKTNGKCGDYELTKPQRRRHIDDCAAAYTALAGILTAEEFASTCKTQWGDSKDGRKGIVSVVASKLQVKAAEAGKRIEAALGDAMRWNTGEPSLKRVGTKEDDVAA